MPLDAGARLGPYEIVSPIGKGGMGEVYRARDTKLDRDVAIKVLPDELAADEERVARFEREAKLLASLNHPNIASIHGFEEADGVKALVLELVEGATLAERIAKGPIPVDEAIEIAEQIAEALEAGHEAGVVHRDLKPANIKLKEDGTVKVLDYGLAKALEGGAGTGADSELSQSPTLTRQGTQIGVILGTAAYMSPEQAKGKRVDKRTDVWAFGAVLYEMLAGKRAFEGDDVSETLAAVLRAEPDLAALPKETPPAVARVIELCLTKATSGRPRHIGDVALAMRGAFQTASPEPQAVRSKARVGLAVAIPAFAGLAAGLWLVGGGARDESSRPARMQMSLPVTHWRGKALAISRDGQRIAYSMDDQIWIRDLAELDARPLPGTHGASRPEFSHDGDTLAFGLENEIKKVALQGGTPEVISSEVFANFSWGADGSFMIAGSDLTRVLASGESTTVAVREREGARLGNPQLLPGGTAVLYTEASAGSSRVLVRELDASASKVVLDNAGRARYLPTGHLIFYRSGNLFAVPFDLNALLPKGSPIAVVEGIRPTAGGRSAHFDVSDTGTLVYLAGEQDARYFVWVDRSGSEEALALPPSGYHVVNLSPDGRRFAASDQVRGDIQIHDLPSGTTSRLTFDPASDSDPVWTPDGEHVYFASARHGGPVNVYRKRADGTGNVERVTESAALQWPQFVTPDGLTLVFDELFERRTDIFKLALDAASEPVPFLGTDARERLPSISPDGRFVAYEYLGPSGTSEILVRSFPDGQGPWQISTGGGLSPRWSRDGRELFFFDSTSLMAAEVDTRTAPRVIRVKKLFEGPYVRQSRSYDVSPDGERFLMIREGPDSDGMNVVIVLNWFRELERLVPTND